MSDQWQKGRMWTGKTGKAPPKDNANIEIDEKNEKTLGSKTFFFSHIVLRLIVGQCVDHVRPTACMGPQHLECHVHKQKDAVVTE